MVSSPAPLKVWRWRLCRTDCEPERESRINAVWRQISLINALLVHTAYICTSVQQLSEIKNEANTTWKTRTGNVAHGVLYRVRHSLTQVFPFSFESTSHTEVTVSIKWFSLQSFQSDVPAPQVPKTEAWERLSAIIPVTADSFFEQQSDPCCTWDFFAPKVKCRARAAPTFKKSASQGAGWDTLLIKITSHRNKILNYIISQPTGGCAGKIRALAAHC